MHALASCAATEGVNVGAAAAAAAAEADFSYFEKPQDFAAEISIEN